MGRLQPHVPPRAASVGGAVDPVAPRRTLPVLRLAAPHPNHVGVGGRHGHVSDRGGRLVVEDRLEGGAVVDGLPHAPGRGAHIEGGRVGLHHGQVGNAAAHDGGPDVAPLQVGHRGLHASGVALCGGSRGPRTRQCDGRSHLNPRPTAQTMKGHLVSFMQMGSLSMGRSAPGFPRGNSHSTTRPSRGSPLVFPPDPTQYTVPCGGPSMRTRTPALRSSAWRQPWRRR